MANASEFRPTALKPSQSKGGLQQALKESLVLAAYDSGDPTASNLKPSLLNEDGTLKSSLLTNGVLKSSLTGLNAAPVSQFINQQLLRTTEQIGLDGLVTGQQPGKGTQRAEQVGRWYQHDGTDDYVRTATEINLTGEYTLSIWAKRDGDTRQEFLFGGTTSNNKFGFGASADQYFIRATGGGSTVTGDCGVDTTAWTCYTLVRDASDKIDLYVNGIYIGRQFSDAAQSGSCYIQRIGSDEAGSDFDGGIKNALVYSRALSLTEIRRLYTHPTEIDETDLQLFYDGEDTHPTLAYDRSGNGNDGTKTNITASTFHATSTVQSDAPFSHQNKVGYSDSANGPVPRDESNRTLDVLGNALDYSGKAPANAQLTKSGCATLDGTDDLVTIADDVTFDITNYFSLLIRAENNNAGLSATQILAAKYDTNADDREWYLAIDAAEKLFFVIGNVSGSSTACTLQSDDAIAIDGPHTYGITFADGVVVMTVDGISVPYTVQSGAIPSVITNQDGVVALGAFTTAGAGGGFYWDGKLFDARIFKGDSTVLTPAQMLALHEGTAESFSGQTNVLWLPMEEKAGDTHYDVSGNGNHGTINNYTESTYFGSTQDVSHYSRTKGFSRRQNKHNASGTTDTNTADNITLTVVDGPYGSNTALRLVPSNTTFATHRTYKSNADHMDDGDYLVAYVKLVGTAHNYFALKMTGASGLTYNVSTGETSNVTDTALVSERAVVVGGNTWKRLAIRIDDVNADVLQMAFTDGTTADGAWTPSNTTDGGDIFFGWVDDPETEPLVTDGTFRQNSASYVPALADGSGDASGLNIQHAAGSFFNNYPGGEVDLNPNIAPKRNNAVRDNLFTAGTEHDFDSWSHNNTDETPDAIEGPDGTYRADLLLETAANSTHYHHQSYAGQTVGTQYTFSVYLKAQDRTKILLYNATTADGTTFDLSAGTKTETHGTTDDSAIESVGDGWYRCSITTTATATSENYRIYLLDATGATTYLGVVTSGAYAWGAKLEEWHEATPFIESDRASEDLPHDWEMPVNIQSNVTLSDTGEWTASNTTVTGGQADPDGGTNAYSLVGTGGGTNIVYSASLGANTTVVGNRYLLSCKIKNIDATSFRIRSLNGTNEADATYTVSTQAVSLSAGDFAWVEDLGSGWLRLNIVYTATITDTRIYLYPNNANNTTGAYFYEPELKRYYENPLFFREITSNGNLHRVDRLLQYNQMLVGNHLTQVENFTASKAI